MTGLIKSVLELLKVVSEWLAGKSASFRFVALVTIIAFTGVACGAGCHWAFVVLRTQNALMLNVATNVVVQQGYAINRMEQDAATTVGLLQGVAALVTNNTTAIRRMDEHGSLALQRSRDRDAAFALSIERRVSSLEAITTEINRKLEPIAVLQTDIRWIKEQWVKGASKARPRTPPDDGEEAP